MALHRAVRLLTRMGGAWALLPGTIRKECLILAREIASLLRRMER